MPSRSSLTLQCDPSQEQCVKNKRVAREPREGRREPPTKKARSTSSYSLKQEQSHQTSSIIVPNRLFDEVKNEKKTGGGKIEIYQYSEVSAQRQVRRQALDPPAVAYRRPAKSQPSLSSTNLKSAEVSSLVVTNPIYQLLQQEEKKPSKSGQRNVSSQDSGLRRKKSVSEQQPVRNRRQAPASSFESRNYERPYRYPTALESSTHSNLTNQTNQTNRTNQLGSQIMSTVVPNPLYAEMKNVKGEKKSKRFIPADEKENIAPSPSYPNKVMEDICNCSCECSQIETPIPSVQPIRRHKSRTRRQMEENEGATDYAASEATVTTCEELGEENSRTRRTRRRKTRRINEIPPGANALYNGPSEDELPCLKPVKGQRQIRANKQPSRVASIQNLQRLNRHESAVERRTREQPEDASCCECCQCAESGVAFEEGEKEEDEEQEVMRNLRPSERSSPRSLSKRAPMQTAPKEYQEECCPCPSSLPSSRHTQQISAESNRNSQRSKSGNILTSATSYRSKRSDTQVLTTVVPNQHYALLHNLNEEHSPPFSPSEASNPQSYETNEEVFCNCEQLAAIHSSKTSARMSAAQELYEKPSDESLPRIKTLKKRGKKNPDEMSATSSRNLNKTQVSSLVVPNLLYNELKQIRHNKKPVSYENVSDYSSTTSTKKSYKSRPYEDDDRICCDTCSCDNSMADTRGSRLQANSFPSRSSYGLNKVQSQQSSFTVPNPLYMELRKDKQRNVLTKKQKKGARKDFSEDEVIIPQASSSFKGAVLSEEICPAPCDCDPSQEEMCSPRPADRLCTPQMSEYSQHDTTESLPTIRSVKDVKKSNVSGRFDPNRMYGEVQKNVPLQKVSSCNCKVLQSTSTNQVPNVLFDELHDQRATGGQYQRRKQSEGLQLHKSRSNMGGKPERSRSTFSNRQASVVSEHSELINMTQYEPPTQQDECQGRRQPFDVPALTPLGQHNIIEELKRELIAAFHQVAPSCRRAGSAVCLCNQRKIVDMGTDPCGSSFPNSISSYHSNSPTTSRNGLGPCSTEAMQGIESPCEGSSSGNDIDPCCPCEEIPSHCSPSYSPERRASPTKCCLDECSNQTIRTVPATKNGLGDCSLTRVPSPTKIVARSRSRSPRRAASPARTCSCYQYECLTDPDYDCANTSQYRANRSNNRSPKKIPLRCVSPTNRNECFIDSDDFSMESEQSCQQPCPQPCPHPQCSGDNSGSRSVHACHSGCIIDELLNPVCDEVCRDNYAEEDDCVEDSDDCREERGNCRDVFVQSSFLCCCCECCCRPKPLKPLNCNRSNQDIQQDDCQSYTLESCSQDDDDPATIYQRPPQKFSSESILTTSTQCSDINEASKLCRYPSPTQRSQVRIILSSTVMCPGADSDVSNNSSVRTTSDYDNCDDDLDYSDSYCFVQDCAAQTSFSDISASNQDTLCFEDQKNSPATHCLPPPPKSTIPLQQPTYPSNCNCNCTCPSRCSYRKIPTANHFLGQVAANAAAARSCKQLTYPSNCNCACKFPKFTGNQNTEFVYPALGTSRHCLERSTITTAINNMSMCNEPEESSVRVAVRIRPQNPREVIDMCRICTTVTSGEPQVVLGQDKAFTFDYVFDINVGQSEVYAECVERLVEGALRGYNATVLAYGQTGSGKTFTMGTGFEHDLNEQQQGIIPRAVRHIFSGIEDMQTREYDDNGMPNIGNMQFSVAAQFMELYNEDIIDLLDPYNKGRVYKIHEDGTGQITVHGATIKPICGPQEALKCLQQGALARTTASTQMNDQSSRSHALFTILIRRQRVLTAEESGLPDDDLETLTSKFHFVDLAGSERLKRTGATGERAREGISINCGLLALGNCISALGDKSKRATHVPYRDSKLTRLLQDSLGGNSQTLMIACVSPCDRDFMETLNTLKYANRARNIKNKVQLNQDQSSRTISQLRREIAALQMELLEFKQGKRLTDAEGNSSISDTSNENAMLLADNRRLQQRLKAMQETINVLTDSNSSLKVEKETHGWSSWTDSSDRSVTNMIAGYISEIEKLQAKLIESEEMYQQLKKSSAVAVGSSLRSYLKCAGDSPDEIINMAKREVEKDRELLMSRSLPGFQEDANNLNNVAVPSNESCDSDTDTESDDKTNEIQADLNDINCDIEIKSKLIEQLELSQQRMQVMRQHYEEKLSVLNSKIMNTQKERDEVLANMGSTPANQPNDKVKKVKEEYERKLNDMQREMKKLQQAQREHIRQQRELQAQEAKLRNLRTELAELKCIKTRLIRKMTEQTNRHKEVETRKAREIATLRKEQRRQQNTVKSLQAQMHAKEQILKRKTEEVSALRRSQRGNTLSQKASGRVPPSKRDSYTFSSRQARQRWDNLSRAISRASRNKQAVLQLEKELERLMAERETLCRDLVNLQKRLRDLPCVELANEEDTIKSNLNYVQENIEQVQHAIMEFEEGKEASNDLQSLQLIIGNVRNVDEAKFLLEHLTNSAISFSCTSALTQNRLSEHESMLKEVQQESGIQQQLLQHFLAQNSSVQISDLFASLKLDSKLNANNLSGSQKSLNSNGTYDIPGDGDLTRYTVPRRSTSRSPSPTAAIDFASHDKNAKVRRRTAQPQDLLFGDSEVSHNGLDDPMTRSYTQQETTSRNFHPLMRVPSAPGSLKESLNSPSLTKKNIESSLMAAATTQPQSPRLARRGIPNKGSPGFDDDTSMIPQSPPVYRKMMSREENSNTSNGGSDVFSRLGAGTQDPAPGGSIQKVTGKIRVGAPLYCTHTVSGHNNSVLSIKVDDDILYTAAADRTVKVWDLSRETAQHCLSTHPGPVIAVQNDKATRLLFSASGPYVRVWDLRSSNTKSIKTLTSSGQVLAGNASVTGVAPGESPITALCMGTSGNLYVAASDKVRIWDLKNLSCVGKLSGGHQAAVMCVTAWQGDADGNTDFVATGSKDHYVKVFEVPKAGGVVYPLLNLEPPHYDGVQALAVAQDAVGADAELFSGSRDSGIKRWDLKSGELKQSLNNAHKGWVSGMAISGDVLLSSCRGGIIRLWNVKSCESLAEMKTDLMINDIVASGQRVFTASSDGKVRMWRFTNTLRRQCSLDNNSS